MAVTAKLGFQLATSLVLFIISVRGTVQLFRRSTDLGLRILVPALWLLTLAATIGIPDLLLPMLKNLLGATSTALIVNGAVVATAYSFAMFFLVVRPDLDSRRRRLRVVMSSGLLVAVAVTWTGVFLTGSPGWLSRPPYTHADYVHFLAFLVFNLSGDVGAVSLWVLASYGGFRVLRAVDQQWAKWGLLLVALGSAMFGLGTFTVALLIDLLHILWPSAPPRFRTLGKVYITALVAGQCLLAIGLAFPTLADIAFAVRTVVSRRRQRLDRQRITTLWKLLTSEFPFVALPERPMTDGRPELPEPPPATGRKVGPPVRVIAEVIDGLSWLAPYYAMVGLAAPTVGSDGEPGSGAVQGLIDAQTAARVVHAALLARARDSVEGTMASRSDAPYPRLVPDIERWADLVRWLAHLSDELSALGTGEELQRISLPLAH